MQDATDSEQPGSVERANNLIDLTVFRNVPYFSIYYDDLAEEYRKVLGGLNVINEA